MKKDAIPRQLSKYYQQDLHKLHKSIVGKNKSVTNVSKAKHGKKYDYIIIPGALGNEYDVQMVFRKARKFCNPHSRLVFNFHSFMWQPFLDLAEIGGLKTKQPRTNWLTQEDIYNLLTLEGFEVVKTGRRFLIPFPLGQISELINKYLAQFPLINNFCLTNYIVARPIERTQGNKPSVSIVVPARNEAGNIENVVKGFRLPDIKSEIIFVEGHSKDQTWETINKVKNKYRDLKIVSARQPGIGKADAVWKGFDLAQNEILVIWDADLTVNPKDFRKFYDAIATNKGEFIFGSRLVYPLEKEAMRTLNIAGNKFFSWAFSWLLGQPIKDTLCGTKVISKYNYDRLVKNRKYFGNFDPFGDFDLIFGAAKLNLKFVEIPIRYQSRSYGKTNISRFTHGWLLLKMVFIALNKLKFV
jgi:hypothetical protein